MGLKTDIKKAVKEHTKFKRINAIKIYNMGDTPNGKYETLKITVYISKGNIKRNRLND